VDSGGAGVELWIVKLMEVGGVEVCVVVLFQLALEGVYKKELSFLFCVNSGYDWVVDDVSGEIGCTGVGIIGDFGAKGGRGEGTGRIGTITF
jgi:hypothetical protein